MTHNTEFKVTPLFDVENVSETVKDKDIIYSYSEILA